MENIKALLIGVSNYNSNIANDLPFCKNDLYLIDKALKTGLCINPSDITLLGKAGTVTKTHLVTKLNDLNKAVSKNDIALIYFSGHAQTTENTHYLCFSDSILETEQYIEYISSLDCKAKIIIIDACNCKVERLSNHNFQSLDSICNAIGKGTIIVTASAPEEKSYFISNANASAFTYFFSSALTDSFMVKDGKKSLLDILYTTSMHVEFYNRCGSLSCQTPQIISNLLGDVIINIKSGLALKSPFHCKNFRKYVIYSADPLHNFESKRYCIKAMLKEPVSYKEMLIISRQIIKKLKKLDIYKNDIQKNKWKHKNTDAFFIYFYLNKNDALNCHHICQVAWFDDQEKLSEYAKLHNIYDTIDNLCFQVNKNYELYKKLFSLNVSSPGKYERYIKSSLLTVFNIGEDITSAFMNFINKTTSEEKYKETLSLHYCKINELYLKNSNTKPPEIFSEIDALYSELLSVLYDIVCIPTAKKIDDAAILSKELLRKYKAVLNKISVSLSNDIAEIFV